MADAPDRIAEMEAAAKWAARASGDDALQAAFAGLIEDLEEMDLPDDVIRQVQMKGPSVLRKGKLPKSLAKKLGGSAAAVKNSFRMAREAAKGITPSTLGTAVDQSLEALQAEGVVTKSEVAQLRAALRKAGPQSVFKVEPNPNTNAIASRAWDRIAAKAKTTAKATATVATKTAKKATGSKLWSGIVGKSGTGMFRGFGGLLAGAGMVSTAYQLYDEFIRKPTIRKNPLTYRDPVTGEGFPAYATRLAAEAGIRPRPVDYLKYQLDVNDRLAQRKNILATQEPTLHQQLITALAGSREDTSPFTRTEMSIGVPTPRNPQPTRKGVESMLDRLLQELD